MLHPHSQPDTGRATNHPTPSAPTRSYVSQASSTALAIELALSGKASAKNLSRAAREVRQTRHDPNGALQRTLSLTRASRESELAMRAIASYGQKLWDAGLDLKGRGLTDSDYDPSLKQALLSEGIVVDYLLPIELREHARTVVNSLWNILCESNRFMEGMRSLESPPPMAPAKCKEWEDTIRHFDRDFLCAAESLRWAIVDAFSTSGPNQELGESIVGPAVSSQSAVETLFLSQLVEKLPDRLRTKVVNRYTKIFSNITIRDYLLNEYQAIRSYMNCLVDLPNKLLSGLAFLGTRSQIQECQEALLQLASIESPQSATLTHLSAPPQYRVTYVTAHPSDSPRRSVTFYHSHSLALLALSEVHKEAPIIWGVDISGAIRAFPQGIPLDETDLNLSKEEFADFSGEVQNGSLAILGKLMAIWERFPDLYAAPLQGTEGRQSPLISDLAISDTQGHLSLRVGREHQHTLAAAILGPSRSAARTFQGHITVASEPGAEVFEIRLPLLPPDQERPADKAIVPPLLQPVSISDQFISDHCPHYTDVVNILAEHFHVIEISGKGSHTGLCLNGHKYPTSKRMRDGTYPMTARFIRSVLEQLGISEDAFVRAVEG